MIEDHHEIPLETTEGWRPDPSRGEGVLVALAAVALLGAVLIVGGNLLNRHDDGVSKASPSPSATAQPSPQLFTPFPTPTPREIVVGQQTPMPQETPRPLYGGWVRALVDLPIHDDSSESASVIGTVPAGTVAYIDEQDQGAPERHWSTVEGPEPTGWVATWADGHDLVKRYPYPDLAFNGGLGGVAAGPNGFLAIGTPAGRQSDNLGQLVYVSADGAAWRAADELRRSGFYPSGVAWGPAGWLLAGTGGDQVRLLTSSNGEHWTSLGVLEPGYPGQLVGSGLGYLLREGDYRAEGTLWFSSDGIHWSESRPGIIAGDYTLTATSAGFYATPQRPCCGQPSSGESAEFSLDGVNWTDTKANLLVGLVDGHLIGIEPAADAAGALAYRGSFYHGRLDWLPLNGGGQPFDGAVVMSLVSNGRLAYAFGWDLRTMESLSWRSDGGPWARQAMPAAFGGPPDPAAAGGAGVIVVGNRENWRGSSPVIWHRIPGGSWEPEASPIFGQAPVPTADECPPPPTDPVGFVMLDGQLAVACYGDRPLKVRLWSGPCDGCYGSGDGTYQEGWLANPSDNLLYLNPVRWPGNSWVTGVLSPDLAAAPDPSWVNAWLELTGHYDDPASIRCAFSPAPSEIRYFAGTASQQDQCRQRFVVTGVKVVDGP